MCWSMALKAEQVCMKCVSMEKNVSFTFDRQLLYWPEELLLHHKIGCSYIINYVSSLT